MEEDPYLTAGMHLIFTVDFREVEPLLHTLYQQVEERTRLHGLLAVSDAKTETILYTLQQKGLTLVIPEVRDRKTRKDILRMYQNEIKLFSHTDIVEERIFHAGYCTALHWVLREPGYNLLEMFETDVER